MNLIKFVSLDIILTRKCNLNCSYCTGHDNKDFLLGLDEIKNTVEKLVKKYKDNKINFIILGGEVTILPKGYLTDVIDYLLSLDKGLGNIHILTNAKIYSEELKNILNKDERIFLGVSFDTTKENLNLRNVSKETVIKNILKYDSLDKTVIHSTLNSFNVSFYKELIYYFYNYGVRIFKFKFIRLDSIIIQTVTNDADKFIRILDSQLVRDLPDIKYANNFMMETTVITKIKNNMELAIHMSEHNERSNRHIIGKHQFDNIELIDIYE